MNVTEHFQRLEVKTGKQGLELRPKTSPYPTSIVNLPREIGQATGTLAPGLQHEEAQLWYLRVIPTLCWYFYGNTQIAILVLSSLML